MIVWLAITALAQEPVEEVTVWGEVAVRQHRSAIVRDIEALGYRSVDKTEGRVLFKPPERWMSRIWLQADGTLHHLRPVLAWKRADAVEWDPVDAAPFERTPVGTASGAAVAGQAGFWVLPAERILRPERERVEAAAEASLEAMRSAIRETSFQGDLQAIPERLDALWASGEALTPGDPNIAAPDRKATILHYWATRTDTREGDLVAEAVVRWLRGTLQDTPDAVTPAEAERAEAVASGRALNVF